MKYCTEEIAKIVRGKLVGDNVEITSVSTDTRAIENGALFVGIKGERFDGNDYIPKAAQCGAAAAISDLPAGTVHAGIPVIYVGNTREALLRLAHDYREKFSLNLCAVTGSVGKTSTKDMIYAVLSANCKTLRTEQNYNNEIGLPRTLFGLDDSYKAAVIEMGMSNRGEIFALSETAHPNLAVITNIGYCHIENLKTRENILAAKLEVLDGMDKDSPLILCGDDEYLKNVKLNRRIVRFGLNGDNDVYADNIIHTGTGERFVLHCDGKQYDAEVPEVGTHHILNALAASCVGREYGMTAEEIIPAFMDYQSSGMRQKTEKHGDITAILDCYNASPTSMESSLSVLGTASGRKIAVLSDMLELGEMSGALHRGLADAVEKNSDMCFLYGREMKNLKEELEMRGFDVFHSEDKDEVSRKLKETLRSGDTVLFKGSRGMKTEEIAQKVFEK